MQTEQRETFPDGRYRVGKVATYPPSAFNMKSASLVADFSPIPGSLVIALIRLFIGSAYCITNPFYSPDKPDSSNDFSNHDKKALRPESA
jgi:hypothetical protein